MRITVVDGEPALAFTVEGRRLLVVADLHLGLEDELGLRGISVPGLSERIADRLLGLVGRERPDELVILGDLKHGVGPPSRSTALTIRRLVGELSGRGVEVTLVKGNHDGGIEAYLPQSVRVVGPRGYRVGKAGLVHGHSWPLEEVLSAGLILAGHIHPAALVTDPNTGRKSLVRVWVLSSTEGPPPRGGVIPQGVRVVVMPAYNGLVGSGVVNSRSLVRRFGPLSRLLSVGGPTHLISLDGTYLGTLEELEGGRRARE